MPNALIVLFVFFFFFWELQGIRMRQSIGLLKFEFENLKYESSWVGIGNRVLYLTCSEIVECVLYDELKDYMVEPGRIQNKL